EPSFTREMREIVKPANDGTYSLDLRFFRHHREQVGYTWNNRAPASVRLFTPELECLLGPARDARDPIAQRHKDLARSVQARYEEALFELLNHLHAQFPCDALALAGGCAMNSVANGKIYARTPFRKVYVQAAAGDAGGGLGAA